MSMGVVFFAGIVGAILFFGGRDAIRDWQASRRLKEFEAAHRLHRAAERVRAMNEADDAFAHQLEEIRNLPEVVA